MKIENIFGLHIGCRVEWNGKIKGELIEVSRYFIGINGHGTNFRIEECKLILKPLSAIRDEDVPILEEHFLDDSADDSVEGWAWEPRLAGFIVDFEERGGGLLFNGSDTIFLLASLGYDIGLVPEEHKIVEGE